MNLARSYRGLRRFAKAHKMFEHALSIAPHERAIVAEKTTLFARQATSTAPNDSSRPQRRAMSAMKLSMIT